MIKTKKMRTGKCAWNSGFDHSLLYDFMGVIIGEICDMMSDIIGLLSGIIGLWWVLKSKNDTNQRDAQ